LITGTEHQFAQFATTVAQTLGARFSRSIARLEKKLALHRFEEKVNNVLFEY
jgi:hypothetical protein